MSDPIDFGRGPYRRLGSDWSGLTPFSLYSIEPTDWFGNLLPYDVPNPIPLPPSELDAYTQQANEGIQAGDRATIEAQLSGALAADPLAGPSHRALALAGLLDPDNIGIQLHDRLVAAEGEAGRSIAFGATAGLGGMFFDLDTALALKAVVGGVQGAGLAALSGVKSKEGLLLTGAVGAAAPLFGSKITSHVTADLDKDAVEGRRAATEIGGATAYLGGFGGELAGQWGDIRAGLRKGGIDIFEANRAGLAALGAYSLAGEGALTAAGSDSLAGEIVTGAGTALGGFGGQKLLDALFPVHGNPVPKPAKSEN
jgi:hypothetical protein